MPYQGDGYVPPAHFGGGNRAFPPAGQQRYAGQAPTGNNGTFHPSAHRSQMASGYATAPPQPFAYGPDASAYRPPTNFSQTAYPTPHFAEQPRPSPFPQASAFSPPYAPSYQSSSPSQAVYPPRQYAPDPLQYNQANSQPYSQQRPSQPQRPVPPQQLPLRREPAPSQSQSQSSQWSRPSVSQTPSHPVTINTAALQRNPSSLQQRQPVQQSQQRSSSGLPRPPPSQVSQSAPQRPQHYEQKQQQHQQRQPSTSSQPRAVVTRPTQQTPTQHTAHIHGQPQDRVDQRSIAVGQPSKPIDPSAASRKMAQVHIPTQSNTVKLHQDPVVKREQDSMVRSPKRRKSNNGKVLQACNDTPVPQQRPTPAPQPKEETPGETSLNLNYQATLLSLSDEYISAAYSMSGALNSADVSEEDLDSYHNLLSLGMGCLEAVLKHCRILDSRKEARVRLRYANLLHEETENDMEAEEVLSKGVSVCERARLLDQKYAMHHLLARVWFKAGKAKTAMKSIDKLITEVEKLGLLQWVYAFRFLRVTLGLQMEITSAETAAMLKHLAALAERADLHEHISVVIIAHTLETLVHLRSRAVESVELAQRALAAARAHQASKEMASMPQIELLLYLFDMACTLARFKVVEAERKLKAMQTQMDHLSERRSLWKEDGRLLVTLCQYTTSTDDMEADTGGILKMSDTAQRTCALTFNWLSLSEAYALGFLLSGLATAGRALTVTAPEQYFSEVPKLCKDPAKSTPQPLSAASALYERRATFLMIAKTYLVFVRCSRGHWGGALNNIESLRKEFKERKAEPDVDLSCLITYLEAICKHGVGDLDGALAHYRAPPLRLTSDPTSKTTASSVDTLRVLAALNSINPMRFRGELDESEELMSEIQKYCLPQSGGTNHEYGSKSMESAFFILKATEPDEQHGSGTIIKTKGYLQSAVQAARTADNNHLLCIVMTLMTAKFFNNIVGDQAEKSARAGRSLAKKCQSTLWMAVADGMYANTMNKCGKWTESMVAQREAEEAMEKLPSSLRAVLERQE